MQSRRLHRLSGVAQQHSKSTLIANLMNTLTGRGSLLAEKSRLEAFLAAVPGDYCGWSKDGSAAYSAGFCNLLGLQKIASIADIQNKLTISDSAALEGVFNRLKEDGIPFQISVQNYAENKTFRISGSRGQALAGNDHFNILWLEDITEQAQLERRYNADYETQQERLRALQLSLNNFPWPLWKRNKDQNLIWCNDSYAAMIGDEKERVLQEQKEISPASRKKKKGEEYKPAGRELAALALESNVLQETKLHVIADGKRLLMRICENPDPDRNASIGFAEDISAQEELESELKRYKDTTKELLEQLRTAIGIFDSDQRLEFYNSAFSQLWGIEDQWLNNRPKLGDFMEKLRENRRLPEQADFRRFKQGWIAMFTSLIDPHEDMLYLPDGSALRMLVVPQSAGGGLMMTFEDVTSRLELESSYNTLIAVQKETLDNLAEGVAVYGGDGRLKLWNPAFARLWGLNPEDLEGDPHINSLVNKKKSYFTEEEWPQKREELVSKGLDRLMHEGRLKQANGTLIDFSTVPLPDGGVLITYTNVTDTVRVENALRDKNAALETAEKLKLDFLANVSYQLRTPLNAIMGFNDILDQEYFGPLNTRQKDYTGDIRSASERLLGLINDILDLSTIEAGYMSLEKESVNLADLLEGTKDLAAEWARKGKVEISLTYPKTIGKIDLDSRRIKQALMNLIRNSINFTPAGGRIDITAKRKKEGIEIQVSDTGIGISREHQTRIFEPFEKAQRGKNLATTEAESAGSKGGAGLGLSLVKNIITLHGGSVNLASEPDKGTTVTIFLPFETTVETVQPIKMKKALSFHSM